MATQALTMQGTGMQAMSEQAQRVDRWAERNQTLLAAQHRARRGPTPEVFFAKRFDNTRIVKAADPARGREMRTFAGAMMLLFALTMVYGWQHLSAIEYGYRIESEKQQLESLAEQNRQLRLSEDELGAPARIDALARKYGLSEPQPGQVVRPDSTPDSNAPTLAEASPVMPALR